MGYCLPSYREQFLKSRSTNISSLDGEPTDSLFQKYPNSTSMGCIIHSFSPECYERLMNKGFRRSGTFLYKPDLLRNCCRMYAIRSNLQLLKPNKEHRHTINRFVKAIATPDKSDSPQNKKTQTQAKNSKKGAPFQLKETLLNAELSASHEKFHTVIGPADPTTEKFELYKKYQIQVHKDDPSDLTLKGFKRFLCDSPFLDTKHKVEDWEKFNAGWRKGEYGDTKLTGPVHECYYLDGKLVAIGVLDILPESISSVYFIWDPDYASLGLGTLSALREMALTEMLGKKYYYLGYYIDDCHKMKYKAKFGGEILDSCSMKFVKLDAVRSITQDGGLVVFQEKSEDTEDLDDESGNNGPEKLNEFEIPPNGFTTLDTSESKKLVNIADKIYGLNGGAFAKADKCATQLAKKIEGLKSIAEQNDDLLWKASEPHNIDSPIPKVSPGLVPLWQINELHEFGELQSLFRNFFLFDPSSGGIYRFEADEDMDQVEEVINMIRLFGIEQCEKNILYVG
ncbi:unnamed protein product [Ambrosiozyma monospora]|uniref:Unnamed protein product n=1 Tax=Ambrosiozyma monospora TaxID=43982 RepID=A0ACB5ST09_AMBMO|nr:unnamed protein product [Ambrosiozyma monospora]